MFQWCFNSVSRVFHGCFKGVSWVFHGCLKVLHSGFKGFSRIFQGCFNCVLRLFQECYKDVSRMVLEVFFFNDVREGVKNTQRGRGMNLATFGSEYVTPPKIAAYQMYPP